MDRILKQHLNTNVKTELSVKKEVKKDYVPEGTLMPKKGHFVWEINKETLDAVKAEYKRNTAVFGRTQALPSEELLKKENCIYIPALNADNAKKKYLQNQEQSAYYVKPAPMSLKESFY